MDGKECMVDYDYTDAMIKEFAKVHLRYRAFHHPLFFKFPAIVCGLGWTISVVGNLQKGTAGGINFYVTHLLLLSVTLVMVFMGFIYPSYFYRKVKKALTQAGNSHVTLKFGADFFEAITGSVTARYWYKGTYACFVSSHYLYIYVNAIQAVIVPLSCSEATSIATILQHTLPVTMKKIL